MDITAEDFVSVVQDGFWIVGEDDLYLSAIFADELGIELNVVHAGEWMQHTAKQFTVFGFGQNIAPWIYALFVEQFLVDQMVAYFVSREAKHQNDFLCTSGNAFEADRETVAAEDWEDDTDGLSAQLCFDIGSDVVDMSIVALCTGDNCLGDSDNIFVMEGESFALACSQYGIDNDLCQVVTFADNRRTNASGYGTYQSFHKMTPLFHVKYFVGMR